MPNSYQTVSKNTTFGDLVRKNTKLVTLLESRLYVDCKVSDVLILAKPE